jgi:DNA-binding transcriptional regulator YhcF (GntR family)
MKVTVGDLQIECTLDEFKSLYPLISAFHNHRSKQSDKEHLAGSKSSTYQIIIQTVSGSSKVWSIKEIASRTGIKPKTIWKHLARIVREGKAKQVGKGRYLFLSARVGSDGRHDIANKISDRKSEHDSFSLNPEAFDEMFAKVRDLMNTGEPCSEFQIKRQFKKLPGSVIESFLSEAIRRGKLKERLGVYALQ